MRYLILSDIHANWEALEAVLADADGDYETICCLGDIVGYGADPNRVAEWVRENCARVIRGNHDKACCGLEEPALFNPAARAAVDWTFDRLREQNRKYLRELPQGPMDLGDFLIVHGSVLDEDEYLIDLSDAAGQFAAAQGRLVFFGHTHVQGGFFLRSANGAAAVEPSHSPNGLTFREGDSMLVNPGSVGQPRDLIWEAGYALYDSQTRSIEYRRCSYDVATAQKKIRDGGLPDALAERLELGR
jgi:predicted phosphodiesterase